MVSICCKSYFKSRTNKKTLQRTRKVKPFIDEHNWKGINQPSENNNWKEFWENNLMIALNVLQAKEENVYQNIT